MRGVAAVGLLLVVLSGSTALATDPPHDSSASIECSSCHTTHAAPGGTLTIVSGNSNLCLSCHRPGGVASALPFAESDQAVPDPGLPAGVSAQGTSHRWDSGVAGHVAALSGNSSSGSVTSGGAHTGRYGQTVTITITASGDAGLAQFSWATTTPPGGSGAGLLTGADVPLVDGIRVTFTDGGSSPSFQSGDQWHLFVRPDIVTPSHPGMAARLDAGKAMCSTCHDQHSQEASPFDASAPPYAGPGSGAGRHFQRDWNDINQLCTDCHQPRDVSSASRGSHPVGVPIPGGDYQPPPSLPLDSTNRMVCMTCHDVHDTPTNDGSLLRISGALGQCTECHTLAATGVPAEHVDTASAQTLWPGGQFGSNFPPVTDPARQGTCFNCHQPHGWPDAGAPANDFPHLLVDREENLCFTCHDGSPVADVRSEFNKATTHPLSGSTDVHAPGESALIDAPARHVECTDCHNAHQAEARIDLPGPMSSPRPSSGPLQGARGIDASGAAVAVAANEYEVCQRCHADSTGKPAAPTPRLFPETNVRLEFNGSARSFHNVAVTGSVNPRLPSLLAGWSGTSYLACTSCHNNDDGPANGAGGAGTNGPHGSVWPHLLERRFETADPSTFSTARYALCFKCHDSQSIRNDESFSEHDKHIRGENVSCNACHDPHASQANPSLINFDTSVVTPSQKANNRLEFIAPGTGGDSKGYCYLTCHGQDHDPFDYRP